MNEISPDGLWRWDGTEWVPNAGTTSAAPPPSPAKKKMPTKQKVAIGAGVVVFAIIGIGAMGEGGDETTATPVATQSATPDPTPEVTDEPTEETGGQTDATDNDFIDDVAEISPNWESYGTRDAVITLGTSACEYFASGKTYDDYIALTEESDLSQDFATTVLASAIVNYCPEHEAMLTAEEPVVEEKPAITPAQENALEAAESYLQFSSFSKAGLIDQLSSEYGSQFDKADAKWAVNHLDVDWNEQALKAAESYLEFSSFSRNGLIDQLTSEYGSQFTKAQAVYAVDKLGL